MSDVLLLVAQVFVVAIGEAILFRHTILPRVETAEPGSGESRNVPHWWERGLCRLRIACWIPEGSWTCAICNRECNPNIYPEVTASVQR